MKLRSILFASVALIAFSCQEGDPEELNASRKIAENPALSSLSSARVSSDHGEIEVYMAEWFGADREGNVVFFNDRGNKQLGADFVPGFQLDGTDDVTYYVDENRPSADVPVAVSTAAIDRAMATWDGVKCSDLGMTKIPSDGRSTGFIANLLGFGGSFAYSADVTHCGWLPRQFFDFLAPQGGDFILGVAFTLVFTGTDFDNNGKPDVAFREIYYNDEFTWNDGSTFDIETVALHEAGHGLSQAHFGKLFATPKNGKFHFAPRAVMNAGYTGVQTEIGKTDNGGHCSNWGEWPNN